MKLAGKRQVYTQAQQYELREALLTATTWQEYRRIAILLAIATSKRNLSDIAREFGVSESMVNHLSRTYRKGGLAGIASRQKGGNHRNMSAAEETELMKGFWQRLENGEAVQVSEIHSAYERKLGRPVSKSVVYYVLTRHQWPLKAQTRQNAEKAKIPNK